MAKLLNNHRRKFGIILSLALVFCSFLPQGISQTAVTEVGSIGLTVSDLRQSIDFYSHVLAFQKVSEVEVVGSKYERLQGIFGLRMRVVRMKLGDESIELTEYLAPQGRPMPQDSRSNDLWFQHIAIVVSDMEKAYAHLRKYNIRHASSAPQRLPEWNKNAAGIEAFYFRDPDGHFLEIIFFPKGKGNARWQKANGKLFLGIDHTAIVVGNTERSLAFYKDLLGFRIAGESENYGTEQEHLNNVFGAHLRITGLRVSNGPGIELLQYLTPSDGRPMPPDIHSNDLMHWQTDLVVSNIEQSEQQVKKAHITFVSPNVVTIQETNMGFRKALLLRDPDGHAVRLIEK